MTLIRLIGTDLIRVNPLDPRHLWSIWILITSMIVYATITALACSSDASGVFDCAVWNEHAYARWPVQSELVVASDGSAQYKTVQKAIGAAPTGTSAKPVVIRVKPGVYKELIYVQREKRFVRLIGEDASKTVLTYGLHANMLDVKNARLDTAGIGITYY